MQGLRSGFSPFGAYGTTFPPLCGGTTTRALLCATYEIVVSRSFVLPPLAGKVPRSGQGGALFPRPQGGLPVFPGRKPGCKGSLYIAPAGRHQNPLNLLNLLNLLNPHARQGAHPLNPLNQPASGGPEPLPVVNTFHRTYDSKAKSRYRSTGIFLHIGRGSPDVEELVF